MSRRIPTCHPDRPHKAKGLCHNCYQTAWAKRYDYMYQKVWQGRNSEAYREMCRDYYVRNLAQARAKRRDYQRIRRLLAKARRLGLVA